MSNTKKITTKKVITRQANIKQANTRKIDTTKANVRQVSTRKANTKKVSNKQISESVVEIIEISLLLLAFGIIAEILFGGILPIGSWIITNLIGSLSTLGEHGFIGVVALGIIVYIFRRGKVFA
jgi:hypothetical protein